MRDRKPYFLQGGVKLLISGHDPERFFNIAMQRELSICQIAETEDGKLTCWTTPGHLKNMKPVLKKTGVKIHILERYGLPFHISKNRGRKLMITGFLAFFLLLYAWSFYIWDISVEGNQKFSDETLVHFMETIPVVNGMRKSEISCEELEADIRNQFNEITWVSAEIRGTRLIVHIRENEALLSALERDDTPCHLAAAKDGVVVQNVIRSGIGLVKAGEAVTAGQILVEGVIPIYDDAGTLVNSHEIHADAEILAETEEKIYKTIPFTYEQTVRTGTVRSGVFMQMFGRPFYILSPLKGDREWEYIMEQEQLKLFENFYLPIYIGVIRAYEVVSYEQVWTEEEVWQVCDQYQKEYMEKLTEKGVQILGSDGRIEQDESGWHFEGTLRLIENIAVEVAIPENQEENQTVNERN